MPNATAKHSIPFNKLRVQVHVACCCREGVGEQVEVESKLEPKRLYLGDEKRDYFIINNVCMKGLLWAHLRGAIRIRIKCINYMRKGYMFFEKYAVETCTLFLSSFSINLLAFYHECRSLIGYATHVLFCDR